MQKEKYYLVIDQGGHATRALVFDTKGEIVCRTESKITTIQTTELIIEHDPQQMIDSVFDVLNKVFEYLGEKFCQIVAAGIATQRSSFVCWNRTTGKALSPIISWQDRRTLGEIEQYLPFEGQIHDKTGLVLNPHYGATKIKWCLDSLKSVKEAAAQDDLCIGPLASFINFHLLINKPFKIDPANASRTLLMNFKTLSWDESLLALFGISKKFLPEIAETKSNYGDMDIYNHTFPLEICTGDQSAAIYCGGEPGQNKIFVNVGTGAFIQHFCAELPDLADSNLLASIVFSHQLKKSYVIEGTVNGAARALDWLAEKTGIEDYAFHLDDWANTGDTPGIFINGISGLGSPYWVPNIRSHFLTESNVKSQFIGVLESIVFLIYMNLLAMKKLGRKAEYIQVSGGLSKSEALCQKLSDLSEMRVIRESAAEATSIGVYYLLTGLDIPPDKLSSENFFPTKNKLLLDRFEAWRVEMSSLVF